MTNYPKHHCHLNAAPFSSPSPLQALFFLSQSLTRTTKYEVELINVFFEKELINDEKKEKVVITTKLEVKKACPCTRFVTERRDDNVDSSPLIVGVQLIPSSAKNPYNINEQNQPS